MGIEPGTQGLTALVCMAAGMVLGLLYDIQNAVIRKRLLRLPGYIGYSLLAALLLLLIGIIGGGGQLRLYMPMYMGLGGLVYLLLLREPGQGAARVIGKVLRLAGKLLLFPVKLPLRFVKKVLKFGKNLFQYACRWYRINAHLKYARNAERDRGVTVEKTENRFGYRYDVDPVSADRVRTGVPVRPE